LEGCEFDLAHASDSAALEHFKRDRIRRERGEALALTGSPRELPL
jgi:hypothetical protein